MSKLNARLGKISESVWQNARQIISLFDSLLYNSLQVIHYLLKMRLLKKWFLMFLTFWQPRILHTEVILELSSQYLVSITENKVVHEKKITNAMSQKTAKILP